MFPFSFSDRVSFFKKIHEKQPSPDEKEDVLWHIMEQEAKAFEFGFYWESSQQILDQVKSECREIEMTSDGENLRDEMGDLLNAAISLCLFHGLDPHDILKETADKFQKRYDAVVELSKKKGLNNLHSLTIKEKLALWDKAKKQV